MNEIKIMRTNIEVVHPVCVCLYSGSATGLLIRFHNGMAAGMLSYPAARGCIQGDDNFILQKS